jgi:hypothetical protein
VDGGHARRPGRRGERGLAVLGGSDEPAQRDRAALHLDLDLDVAGVDLVVCDTAAFVPASARPSMPMRRTSSASSTCRTPGTFAAARTASARWTRLPTVPRTAMSDTASSSTVVGQRRSTTLILFVTPVTPYMRETSSNARSLWNWKSTSPVRVIQPSLTWTSR